MLRALRTGRAWSLDRAAQETGVSKAMLGQIERGESSPTIATLWKIASGFNTSLSSLIEPMPIGEDESDEVSAAAAPAGELPAPLDAGAVAQTP